MPTIIIAYALCIVSAAALVALIHAAHKAKAQMERALPRCPECGREAHFTQHEAEAIGGEYDERWLDIWWTCGTCGAQVTEHEIERANRCTR